MVSEELFWGLCTFQQMGTVSQHKRAVRLSDSHTDGRAEEKGAGHMVLVSFDVNSHPR